MNANPLAIAWQEVVLLIHLVLFLTALVIVIRRRVLRRIRTSQAAIALLVAILIPVLGPLLAIFSPLVRPNGSPSTVQN